MDELWLDVEGRPIRCLTSGRGRPLLLCHGFLSSAEEFGGRFTELAEQHQLIVPDLPGNGGSAPLPVPHTADSIAATLETLLRQLGVEALDVAGVCLGASVACALARRCGERVDRLVLHTPLIAPALIRRFYREQVRIATIPAVWRAVVALSRNRTVSNLYKRFVIAEGDVDDRTAQANFDNQLRADAAAAREWLRNGVQHEDLDVLLERGRPTLVIVAEHDQMVDIDRLQRLIAKRENIKLVIDRAQSHGWNHEAVRRQLTVMQEFFGDATSQERSSNRGARVQSA